MSIEKFAFRSTRVWNIKGKEYYYEWIWLCWYWEDCSEYDQTDYYTLDGYKLKNHSKVRSSTNRW